MSKVGEIVAAKIVEVAPLERVRPGVTRGGYCRVESEWGEYTLVTGSVQSIPERDRVVGKEGRLEWVQRNGYSGPVWLSKEESL